MDLTISGVDETLQMLAEAPKHIVVTSFAGALRAGIDVIAETMQSMTPESEIERDFRVHLADSMVTEVVVDSQGRGGVAEVGYGANGWIAEKVEYGHRMVTHAPDKRQVGQVPAHPFMRPAADVAADAAIQAFQNALVDGLKREY